MVSKSKRLKKKINSYLFDHQGLKVTLESFWGVFIAAISALTFAIGYSCFVIGTGSPNSPSFVTGGLGGLSQTIIQFTSVFTTLPLSESTLQSIFYLALNIPVLIFAFRKVGIKFAIFSLVDVGLSSLFIYLLDNTEFVNQIKNVLDSLSGSMVIRVIFAAICIGFSCAIAFKAYFSAGGIDVFSYYFALKKSTGAGKINLILNAGVIFLYNIVIIIKNPGDWAKALISVMYSLLYLIIISIVIDLINVRNKKVQVQIVTTDKNLPDIMLANFPHSMTIMNAKGAYSKKDKMMLFMTVSSLECKEVIKVVQAVDPHAFIDVFAVTQVYGNFFIKPVE